MEASINFTFKYGQTLGKKQKLNETMKSYQCEEESKQIGPTSLGVPLLWHCTYCIGHTPCHKGAQRDARDHRHEVLGYAIG